MPSAYWSGPAFISARSPTRLPSRIVCVISRTFLSAGEIICKQSAETARLSAIGRPDVHVGTLSAKPPASHGFESKVALRPKFGELSTSRYVVSLIEPSWLTTLSDRPVYSEMSHEWLPLSVSPS